MGPPRSVGIVICFDHRTRYARARFILVPVSRRLHRVRFRGHDLVVLSLPLPDAKTSSDASSVTRGHAALTPAELDVARLLHDGLSNAEIAAARGSALRTVANQVASILRKLGVASRHHVRVDPPPR